MPHFGQERLEQALAAKGLDDPDYRAALERAKRIAGPEGIDAALAHDRLDVLVAPTGGPAWLTDWINGDCFGGGSASPAAVSGYPNLTVPMGAIGGLPVGLSVFGARHADVQLVRVAAAYEAATRHRRPPRFAPSAGGNATGP
jgi:amidase